MRQKKDFPKALVSNEKLMKIHTAIAEDLILPAAIDMCETVLDRECRAKLKEIPLSNNTISRRIGEMSSDIKAQLLEKLKQTYFAIQLDESTDIASQAQLLVYVRYCWGGEMIEDFMFCHRMQGRTTGLDVFNVLCDFFSQMELSWERCVGICTDGAASMTGKHSETVARIKLKVPNIVQTHCMIHSEVLAAKHLGKSLSEVLSACVEVVKSIKARPLQSRLFSLLCDELGSQHSNLLLHTKVRWLSRGKIVERVFELRKELLIFLQEHNPHLASFVADETWLGKLAYLADIFNLLNQLNLPLQRRNANILLSQNKITAFTKKHNLRKSRIDNNVVDMFPVLCDYIENKPLIRTDLIFSDIQQHLELLCDHFTKYFLKETFENFDWILNPFLVGKTDLLGCEEEELAELLSDRTLMMSFNEKALASFWLSFADNHPLLSQKAIKMLLPFATTYLCETAFSVLTNMKTKYRSRLAVESDLRVCLTKIVPRIEKLCCEKQPHPSH